MAEHQAWAALAVVNQQELPERIGQRGAEMALQASKLSSIGRRPQVNRLQASKLRKALFDLQPLFPRQDSGRCVPSNTSVERRCEAAATRAKGQVARRLALRPRIMLWAPATTDSRSSRG